jgi:hypothetical protein
MKGYRYYESDLDPGYIDRPKSDHLPELSPDKQKAEIAIRQGDKRGSLRAHAIFVFEKLEVAKGLLGKTPGKHLYEMEIDADGILHRADLRIYDEIVEALKRNKSVDRLVKEFWQGIERPSPRMELTVRKAIVVEKLVDDRDK